MSKGKGKVKTVEGSSTDSPPVIDLTTAETPNPNEDEIANLTGETVQQVDITMQDESVNTSMGDDESSAKDLSFILNNRQRRLEARRLLRGIKKDLDKRKELGSEYLFLCNEDYCVPNMFTAGRYEQIMKRKDVRRILWEMSSNTHQLS